jgi:hypothetical protein
MRSIITTVCVLLTASFGHAQDRYSIKLKINHDVGKTITYRSMYVPTGSMKFFDTDGKLLGEDKNEENETSYRTTVFVRDDKEGTATKFVRVYDKALEKEGGKARTFSYHGRTLLFEKRDGKFRVGVVGEPPLDAKEVEKLLRDLNKKGDSDALYRNLPPAMPVKVGDSWFIPVKPVAGALAPMPADVEKSSIAAKLVKVYSKGQSQFGTFEIAIRLVLVGKSEEEPEIAFDSPATMTGQMTVDIAIDGSSTERKETGTISLKGEGTMTGRGKKLHVVFDISGTGSDEASAEADDPRERIVPNVTFAAAPGEWAEFKEKDHAFQVNFPGTPQKKVNSEDGINTTEYGLEVDNRRVYYSVIVSDFPADKFKLNPTNAYRNLKKEPNIKESADIKICGLPGVELKMEIKKSTTHQITRRALVVGQRLYQLLVVVEEGRKADAMQFFDSFKLDEKLPAKNDK